MSNDLSDSEVNELRALFSGLNDGLLTPDKHARLQDLLLQNAEARRLWFLHCDIEWGLADWVSHTTQIESRASELTALPLPRDSTLSRRANRRWRFWIAAAMSMAAAVVVAIMLRRPTELSTQGVAVLSRVVDVEWSSDVEARSAGAVLGTGMFRVKSGAALVEFYSGARVVVEGPAEFQLVSASEGFLRAGRINAHVPPQARGFKVRTARLDVVDLGTDFGLAVSANETGNSMAEVHVFDGLVEVTSPDSHSAVRALNTGEAVRLERDALVAIPSDQSAFLLETELAQREAAANQVRFVEWREACRSLSSDPGVLLHYSFAEDDHGVELRNRAARPASDSNGNIVGCERIGGRWAEKAALQFRREGDRVRFSVNQPLEQVTLLAWIRVDALPHGMHSVMSADAEQVGSLLWQITSRGQLRLEIGRDLGRRNLDWEAVNSEPVVTPDRFGQWLLLATTFDGSTIRHFVNGKACGRGASFRPPALRIGAAQLANWHGRTLRHFIGAFDEFAILSRVMSDQELTRYYEASRP